MIPPVPTVYFHVVRNPQEITPGIFLCETQRGRKGTGKVWNPSLIRPNRAYDPAATTRWKSVTHELFADVRAAIPRYRRGQFKVQLYGGPDHRYIEAFFPDQLTAVQFMIHNERFIHVRGV